MGAAPFDIIEGKARGLVTLFHGPPGVGKAHTAKTIALATASSQLKSCNFRCFCFESEKELNCLCDYR